MHIGKIVTCIIKANSLFGLVGRNLPCTESSMFLTLYKSFLTMKILSVKFRCEQLD